MHSTALWLTPLILLVGVALLIVSTSTRETRLASELREARETAPSDPGLMPLTRRCGLFRQASISLYISVGVLACASLVGGWAAARCADCRLPASALTAAGIACLLFAAIQLIRETLLNVAQGNAAGVAGCSSAEHATASPP